ncbi:hypothetical protein OG698_46795 [Streptomyces sp. NBC_01003]|nr:hypothetical protein OG698_46795 [Streptomyces sp. NBC_01003]
MDARELAPQLLFFVEAGVQEGSHRFQALPTTSYGTVQLSHYQELWIDA